eukprot:gnl/TRDRNA2_/TRDRNA2_143642_c0_seq2.p1 gnl/TRDRNA2_/TRDRNA2_143642_c0~~gnl/TRDRNA2_/TRDRNA2_143642_c0_seq2.p1  ORF type:complete len:115 (-),score=28.05 gnl/TRDRNA2_/TRDRNA2_143642_c0_seq2:105-449(-)
MQLPPLRRFKRRDREDLDKMQGGDDDDDEEDKDKPKKNPDLPRSYEEEFPWEMKRMASASDEKEANRASFAFDAGSRRNPFGQVLHGYDRPVYGETPGERLDLRAASKSDKYCK